MNVSKKWQIVIFLILTCNFSLGAVEEPNDPNTPQIRIETSDQVRVWVRNETNDRGRGPIRPTHVAEVFARGHIHPFNEAHYLLRMSAGAAMTVEQHQFIDNSDALASMGFHGELRNYYRFLLYAVSEGDARRMVEAFIDFHSETPTRERLEYVNNLRAYKEEMAKAKGLLPGKEALLPSVKGEYDKAKEDAHLFLADTEAAEQAKETIVEMGKKLDALDVELAGIREKLKVIQDYWSQDGAWTKEAFAKLQELQIIQTIELKGAEARKNAAAGIRQREKDFLDLFDQWTSLEAEVKKLRSTIYRRQKDIAEMELVLADPERMLDRVMLPPKIYENKVVIYPVKAD